jgi:hypothetical protein
MTVSQKTQPDARKKKTWYMLSDESSLPMAPGCHGTDFTCTIQYVVVWQASRAALDRPNQAVGVRLCSHVGCVCACASACDEGSEGEGLRGHLQGSVDDDEEEPDKDAAPNGEMVEERPESRLERQHCRPKVNGGTDAVDKTVCFKHGSTLAERIAYRH